LEQQLKKERKQMNLLEYMNLLNEANQIGTTAESSGSQLRACAQIHASLIGHHALCIENLIDNADEADMNKRMGEEKRKEAITECSTRPRARKNKMTIEEILKKVSVELERAEKKFPPFSSGHEGFAVIKEELDELWDNVKANHSDDMLEECIQVAAMAVRFAKDLCCR
jgi:hypothetical protein